MPKEGWKIPQKRVQESKRNQRKRSNKKVRRGLKRTALWKQDRLAQDRKVLKYMYLQAKDEKKQATEAEKRRHKEDC